LIVIPKAEKLSKHKVLRFETLSFRFADVENLKVRPRTSKIHLIFLPGLVFT